MFGNSPVPPPPPQAPTQANASVITSGLSALAPSKQPGTSDMFTSLINQKGGVGIAPTISNRTLVGGAS